MTEDDLEFVPLERPGFTGEAWSVRVDGKEIATVAERVVSVPPFVVRWPSGSEALLDDREQVVAAILRRETAR